MIYKDFAQIYDNLMYDFNYDLVYKSILDLYTKSDFKVKNILELACGTGSLTEKLAPKFNVDAIDFSEDMLAVAQNKTMRYNNVKYFKQDMRTFHMGKKYDSCLCICDSLNYILEENDIEKIFKSVYEHLEDGGVFIFDLNSEKKFQDMSETYVDDTEDVFYVWENFYDEENKLNTYGVNFFIEEEKGLYRRVYEEHVERAYSIEFIKDKLNKTLFKNIEIYDDYYFDEEFHEDSHRIVFVAWR